MMDLLESAQSSSSFHLEEPTTTSTWNLVTECVGHSYSVMNAWSKTSTQIGAVTAYAVFKWWWTLMPKRRQYLCYCRRIPPRKPTRTITCWQSSLVEFHTNCICKTWKYRASHEGLWTNLLPPTIIDYNALLSAFAKIGKAWQAESLLREMMCKHDIQPDIGLYNCILDTVGARVEKRVLLNEPWTFYHLSQRPIPRAIQVSCMPMQKKEILIECKNCSIKQCRKV
jgi:pentatricopeptide repeat protein